MNAKQIKKIRSKLGLSQVQFAKKIHVSLSAVVKWEAGKQEPQQRFVDRIERLKNG